MFAKKIIEKMNSKKSLAKKSKSEIPKANNYKIALHLNDFNVCALPTVW